MKKRYTYAMGIHVFLDTRVITGILTLGLLLLSGVLLANNNPTSDSASKPNAETSNSVSFGPQSFFTPDGQWTTIADSEETAPMLATFTLDQSLEDMGTVTVGCAGSPHTVWGSGGPGGGMSGNEDLEATFCSDNGLPLSFVFETIVTAVGGRQISYFIHDGNSTAAPQLPGSPLINPTGFVGTIWTSTSDCITIRYTRSGPPHTSSWQASLFCSTQTDIDACTGNFYDSGGPGGPTAHLESSITKICSDNGGLLTLDFTSFDTDNNFDFLYVYDGEDRLASQIAGSPFTGTSGPGTVNASGTCLTFLFVSDSSFDGAGWAADISCGPPVSMGIADYTIDEGGMVSTCTGIFADSGDTDMDYGDGENHSMTFCSDMNNQISFTFEHFNVAAGDELTVYDGSTTGDPSLGSFSGFGEANSPGVVTSSGTCLTFEFTSNGSGVAPGWQASISCTGTPEPGPPGGGWTGYPISQNCGSMTELGGTVFEDIDNDGQRDSREAPIKDVVVTLYDDDGYVDDTATDGNGEYSFSGLNAGQVYRVEFTIPEKFTEGAHGPGSSTAVQFVESGKCNADLGILDEAHYCDQTDPYFAIPCYNNGMASHMSNSGATGIARFRYSDSGDSQAPTYENYVTFGSVGTIWGTAYNGETDRLYMSSILKRHAGLGPSGIGAIYKYDDADGDNLGDLFYDFGGLAGSVVAEGTRFPGTGSTFGSVGPCAVCDNIDPTTFSQIGKVGFGDIELNPDLNELYVTNLADRKIYKLDADNPTPGSATALPGIPWLSNAPCSNGVARPWALEWRRGILYVGVVCDASSSSCMPGTACSDLTANVYSFDGASWTQELSFPLDYYRQAYSAGSDYFVRWIDDWNTMIPFVANVTDANFAQPVVMDIEFDDDHSIIIGIGDRSGFQMGYQAPPPPGPSGSTAERNMVSGDILRASFDINTGNYTLENNGSVGGLNSTNPNNSSGPGGKSFYWGDFWTGIGANRFQGGIGSLALLPGSGEIMFPLADAIDYYSNGIIWIDNDNGSANKKLEVYQGSPDGNAPNFAKSAGVGDMELFCAPPPVEIGNIVWWDENQNGRQDPSEAGIPGVTLELWYDPTGSAQGNMELNMGSAIKVAETTTDDYGRYIFSRDGNNNGLNAEDWNFDPAHSEVRPNSFYQVRIPNWETESAVVAFRDGLGYTMHLITPTQNQGPDGGERDNSAYDNPGNAAAAVATGDFGENNHSFDFAFGGSGGCERPRVIPTASTPCEGETLDLMAGVSGGVAPYTYSWDGPGGFSSADQNPTRTISDATTHSGTYNLTVTDAGGCEEIVAIEVAINNLDISLAGTDPSCGSSDGSIDLTVNEGFDPISFSWNTGATTEDLSSLGGGSYNVMVTDADGCTDSGSESLNAVGSVTVTEMHTDETCTDGNGTITLTVGAGATSITWSDGPTGVTSRTGLSAGIYSADVNNSSGCIASISVEIFDTPGPSLSATQVDETCSASNGSIDLTISGGTPPYDIDWDDNG
ncbi:MAG: SdrD B-like domain-containing protein, partial [Bacteroidota bacterium]